MITASISMKAAERRKLAILAFGDFFFPDEDRHAFAEGLNRGGYLVTVRNIPDHQYERALDILDDEGAVDLDARESEWRGEGWTGYGATAAREGSAAAASHAGDRTAALDADLSSGGKIDVVEEQVSIGKRQTEGGRVRVRSYVVEAPVE